MANNAEHYLFREYSIAVKSFLQKTCWIGRYPKNQNVQIFYTTPARAFAKYIAPVISGQQLNPLITFDLTNFAFNENETPNLWTKETQKVEGENRFEKIKHPLPYTLTYRVTMWTSLQSDMDILLYQIITNSTKNRKYNFVIDEQWAELYSSDPRKETQMEPGEVQDVVHRYGLDLIVPRAYIPFEIISSDGIILDTDITLGASYNYDI